MEATTIKIENPLLNDIRAVCPKNKSLSAFVRGLLERDVQRKKMAEAAEKYSEFLSSNPGEKEWLDGWEASSLALPPKKSKKRKKQ